MTELVELQYQQEYPYLEQTLSWREGMRYRYSPDQYPLTLRQANAMREAGCLVGIFLQNEYGNKFAEFRLDFVQNEQRELFITEIQTDDRGLPAIANVRNSKGESPDFPGIVPSFIEGLKIITRKNDPSLVVIFPEEEYFYYTGFYDFARIANTYDPDIALSIFPDSAIHYSGDAVVASQNGAFITMRPDLIWDFTNMNGDFQPLVTKQPLVDIWRSSSSLACELRQFIPYTTLPDKAEVKALKKDWILKPIAGRWSKGVVLGFREDEVDWKKSCETPDLIAQRYILPYSECFNYRNSRGNFEKGAFFARIEGYYTLTSKGFNLVDILVTCTPEVPVHGRRDCIMIPARII